MKALGVIVLLNVVATFTFSQSIDYNKIIVPANVKALSFEEKLIQLAWNNHPSNKIVEEEFNQAAFSVKEARYNWLNDIYAVGNINEFTIDPSADINNRAQFFPRYNFSLRFSLGTFAITPLKVKTAKSELTARSHAINQQKLEVRTTILDGVERLKEYYRILRFRRQLMEDLLLVYKDAEKQFYQGKIKIEEYRAASQAYSIRAESVIAAESEFNRIQIEIEGIIGLRLGDVEGYDAFIAAIDVTTN